MKEKEAIYAKEDFTDEDGIRASELEAEFADMDGWEAESNAESLLNGLGIGNELHYSLIWKILLFLLCYFFYFLFLIHNFVELKMDSLFFSYLVDSHQNFLIFSCFLLIYY